MPFPQRGMRERSDSTRGGAGAGPAGARRGGGLERVGGDFLPCHLRCNF